MKKLISGDVFLTNTNNVFVINWITLSRASCKLYDKPDSTDIIFNVNAGRPIYALDSKDTFVKIISREEHPEYYL